MYLAGKRCWQSPDRSVDKFNRTTAEQKLLELRWVSQKSIWPAVCSWVEPPHALMPQLQRVIGELATEADIVERERWLNPEAYKPGTRLNECWCHSPGL